MASAEPLKTFCRICEATCGLLVDVDERAEPIRIRPDREHPSSQGFVCAKGTRFLEVARHPERLLRPMRRNAGGALEAVSWDDAFRFAGNELRDIIDRHGPHAVGVYFGNPVAFNSFGTPAMYAFMKALGTRNIYSADSQDCNNKFPAAELVHGSPLIHPIPDFAHADLAVLFGTNPAISQSSFVHLEQGSLAFDRLVERGGRATFVDPRRTESARRWGTHLAIRPGTDAYLLLALVHELRAAADRSGPVEGLRELCALAASFPAERAERVTGIPADEIRRLADDIRSTPRVALHMSVGVNQGPFGTLSYVALQAVAYLAGHLDKQGGSLFSPLAVQAARVVKAARVFGRATSRIGGFRSNLDTLPGGILADEILTPGADQIRALIIIAGDPVASVPGGARLEEAFGKLDFVVAIDLFENRTGRHADLLLPTTSWLERGDLGAVSAMFQAGSLMQATQPVMRAPGEVRPEAQIFLGLRRAMGLGTGASGALALPFERLLRLVGRGRYGLPTPRPKPGSYLGRGSLHPGHVLRFWDAPLDGERRRLEEFAREQPGSLRLIGRRRRLGHNGWLHDARRDGDSEAAAWMSAEDLASLGLASGQTVQIASPAGRISLPVLATDGVARGTVVIPHGVPEANVNALIPTGSAAVERLSGMLHMTGIPVSVAPA